ncbi:hypothetical protein CHS0354_012796, partial [Potamilus streckersoni]
MIYADLNSQEVVVHQLDYLALDLCCLYLKISINCPLFVTNASRSGSIYLPMNANWMRLQALPATLGMTLWTFIVCPRCAINPVLLVPYGPVPLVHAFTKYTSCIYCFTIAPSLLWHPVEAHRRMH